MASDSSASHGSRVVWKEGTFLRPHHFQQQDRYVESLIEARAQRLRPYPWGLAALRYDRDFLLQGKLRITECRGIFPDGTPFSIPDHDDEPQILDLPAQTTEQLVYLTLPARRDGGDSFTDSDDPEVPIRYLTREVELADNNAGADARARVLVGKRRLHLRLQGADLGAFTTLPLVRIREIGANKNVSIDDSFIPPCLDCRAVARLHGFIKELQGLLQHRAEALSGRLVGGGGTAEIADLLLLQAVNQSEPLFAHLVSMDGLHPEDFFRVGLQTAGALATFSTKVRRPARIPPYRHHDLQSCFDPLMAALREYLSMVIERNVVQIPLKDAGHGVRVGIPPDRDLLDKAVFVLAAKADMNTDMLRQSLPANIKIGPVERIAQLVNLQLRGVPIRALAVAPRQLPFHQGFAYFELDKTSEVWGTLRRSGGIGIFAGSAYPGLELELWAIRSD
jgi:type VI secretion system protein ImpJ